MFPRDWPGLGKGELEYWLVLDLILVAVCGSDLAATKAGLWSIVEVVSDFCEGKPTLSGVTLFSERYFLIGIRFLIFCAETSTEKLLVFLLSGVSSICFWARRGLLGSVSKQKSTSRLLSSEVESLDVSFY